MVHSAHICTSLHKTETHTHTVWLVYCKKVRKQDPAKAMFFSRKNNSDLIPSDLFPPESENAENLKTISMLSRSNTWTQE